MGDARATLRYALTRLRRLLWPPVTITPPPTGAVLRRDVAVAMPDGTLLRVNVFLPEPVASYLEAHEHPPCAAVASPAAEPEPEGMRLPVIMCAHPYGKDKLPSPGRPLPQYRLMQQSVPITHSAWTAWEAPDPAFWVARGYVVVNADLRGFGRSEGVRNLLTEAEGRDYAALIEWAANQPWSNGRVGLLGVSYLALSQWRVASLRPRGLAAICPWEGFSDLYRDLARPGGIREDGFFALWARGVRQAKEMPDDLRAEQQQRPLLDAWWRERTPDLEQVEVPALVCASFSDHSLHTRGSFRGFARIGSQRRWLYTHRAPKWAAFYAPEALELQARFFDCYLKGTDNGWEQRPPVRVEVRSRGDEVHRSFDTTCWPPPGVRPLALRLGADGTLQEGTGPALPGDAVAPAPQADIAPAPPRSTVAAAPPQGNAAPALRGGDGAAKGGARGSASFDMRRGRCQFVWQVPRELELVGPMRLRLYVEVQGADDVHLFVGVRKLSGGNEVPFEGSYGYPLDMVTKGWLKASMRAVDEAAPGSCQASAGPWEVRHTFTTPQPLRPGEIVACDLELLPSATRFARGDVLRLDVQGHWFTPWHPLLGQFPAAYEPSPRGRCVLHFDVSDGAWLWVPLLEGGGAPGAQGEPAT